MVAQFFGSVIKCLQKFIAHFFIRSQFDYIAGANNIYTRLGMVCVCAFHRLLINWILSYKKPKEKPVLSAIHKFKFHLYVNESGLFSLEVFNSHNLLRWMQWISFSTITLDCQNVKKQKSIKWMQNYFCKSSTKPLSQDASKVKWKRHKFMFYLCDYYYRNVNYIIQT